MWFIYLVVFGVAFWYFFTIKKQKDSPPGPHFTLPVLGQWIYLGTNRMKSFRKLRKKYGDIFHLESKPGHLFVLSNFKMLQEIAYQDNFSGRWDIDQAIGENLIGSIKGGHGMHGLILSTGNEWKEQRKFALRNLKDLGFGKSSMEEIIREEFMELAEDIKETCETEEEIETNQLFNLSVLNVMWQMITGKRYSRKDPVQIKRLQDLAEMFASSALSNIYLFVSLILWPKILRKWSPLLIKTKNFYTKMFSFFEKEYIEHEKTYDPNDMRDFTDIYVRERKRAIEEQDVKSSFYGEAGHWNFVSSMFDLFLAGSETTSTSLTFVVLYCVHFPSVQKKLHDELDSVVGKSRMPTVADKTNMPYLEAFLSELQRHATIVPFGAQHANHDEAYFRGYRIPKNSMIIFNQYEIMRDEANFKNADKFDPDRFLDENGLYKSHPALIPFGIGKRECLGKSLAKMEMFLFTSMLLQQFCFEPGSDGIPSLDEALVSITRVPAKFKVRAMSRI